MSPNDIVDEVGIYAGEDPAFANWLRKVNRRVRSLTDGMGIFDFADAPWRDAFDVDPELLDIEAALDVLAEADEMFAALRDMTE